MYSNVDDLRCADGTMGFRGFNHQSALSGPVPPFPTQSLKYHICRGHVLVMDHPSGRLFFLVEEIHDDTNIGLKGIDYCLVEKTDGHINFLVQPVHGTCQRYGCADTLP